MKHFIDTSRLRHVSTIVTQVGSDNDMFSLYQLLQEAQNYLLAFDWCREIIDGYLGLGVDGILAVYLFQIVHDGSADEWIWVIVGDLPPAYIAVSSDTPNGACALDGYMGEMQQWINAVKAGRTENLADIIDVNAPPTKEYADMLDQRFRFIDEHILPEYGEDLG